MPASVTADDEPDGSLTDGVAGVGLFEDGNFTGSSGSRTLDSAPEEFVDETGKPSDGRELPLPSKDGKPSSAVEDDDAITPTSATSAASTSSSAATLTPTLDPRNAVPVATITTASPLRDRNLRPKKGILKPAPPPTKPGISLKIRDALGSIHPRFYDYAAPLPLQLQQSAVGEWANGVAGGIAGTTANLNLNLGIPEGLRPTEGGTVQSVANNVLGVGEVVGGAAVAIVGNLGGRFGRFMGGRKVAMPSGSEQGAPLLEHSSPVSRESNAPTNIDPLTSSPATAPPQPAPAPPSSDLATKPLKRATFILPLLSTTYPISASQAPYSSQVLSEKNQIDRDKYEEIGRCKGERWWTQERLVGLYEAACRGREEVVRVAVRDGLMAASVPHLTTGPSPPRQLLLTSSLIQTPSSTLHSAPPKSYFLVEQPLGKYAAEAMADVLRVEWGLKKLALEGGIVDGDDSLKAILHALLISGTLLHLSLAGNRKIKPGGWRVAAQYVRKSQMLRYLDVSDNIMDRRSMEFLVQAVSSGRANGLIEAGTPAGVRDVQDLPGDAKTRPEAVAGAKNGRHAALQTLRMDNCSLRAGSLEVLGQGIRRSDVKNISLRKNKIGAMGAVAIAVMIRDFPDAPIFAPKQGTTAGPTNTVLFSHDSPPEPGSPLLQANMTAVQDVEKQGDLATISDRLRNAGRIDSSTSAALQQKVKQLESSERLGSLVTLDVKANDIRSGVSYIAQVLKRNRTLKVLNLSDNRVDATGLAAIADAMKYNTTLETLDLSQNPCCGPTTEGIMGIRSMLSVNTTLKRLFLSSTGLTTEGAIALAEIVPDCRGVIHLDLTGNPSVELAGIMAISVALRSNKNMRCLDLTVPQNDPQMAELSQSILQSCIRNTETAAAASSSSRPDKTAPSGVWAPIQKSALVRQAKEAEQAKAFAETQKAAITPAGHARQEIYKLKPDGVIKACEEVAQALMRYVERGSENGIDAIQEQDEAVLIERSKALMERVADLVQATNDDQKLERLLALNDVLVPHTAQAEEVLEKRKAVRRTPARVAATKPQLNVPLPVVTQSRNIPQGQARRHMRVPSLELTSPNFSITNSDDDDSDAEELSSTVAAPATVSQAAFVKGRSPSKYETRLSLSGLGLAEHDRSVREPEEDAPSPLKEVNRNWMAEEGEIFRKGAKLGVADDEEDEDEADISGQDLKRKILDAEVARTPHAPIPPEPYAAHDPHEET